MTTPYTHATHARRCYQAGRAGVVLPLQLVQVKRKNVVYCARIRNAWTTPDGLDCWTVDTLCPEEARITVPVSQVRLCDRGDGRCSCAGGGACGGAAPAIRPGSET